MLSKYTLVFSFIAGTRAHFFMQDPPFLGFDDSKMTEGPCGGFDPATTREGVSDFSVGGSAISVLTTHLDVVWEYHAALLSDINKWVSMQGRVHQTGVGDFCLPSVQAPTEWAGKDGVIQLIQHAPDGLLHQCAAVKFVSGGPESVPSSCTNGTGVRAEFEGGSNPPASTGVPISSKAPESTAPPPSKTAAPKTTTGGHEHEHPMPTTAPTASGHDHEHPTGTASEGPSETESGYEHQHPSGTVPLSSQNHGNMTASATTSKLPDFTGAADVLKVKYFAGGLGAIILAAL